MKLHEQQALKIVLAETTQTTQTWNLWTPLEHAVSLPTHPRADSLGRPDTLPSLKCLPQVRTTQLFRNVAEYEPVDYSLANSQMLESVRFPVDKVLGYG